MADRGWSFDLEIQGWGKLRSSNGRFLANSSILPTVGALFLNNLDHSVFAFEIENVTLSIKILNYVYRRWLLL